ncbi:hypothetical protein H2199_009061 [Coniosporium tulheliwenetii]|uniref:Uncharacterized protein n=1 Tax=Coniosporium tulheliwenetii TaxID=3383036 RepID=A0ACC2YG51_9PEZI|nr:hypothetical protein H2199_009061 [Cladosporium sp. JES 115]
MAQFLDLPPEIRLYIYQYVFRTPTGWLLGRSKVSKADYCCLACFSNAQSQQEDMCSYAKNPQSTGTNVALLYTSRLINAEATSLFYSTNTISLHSENNADILTWLRTIGAANRESLRHLEVDFSCGIRLESQRFGVRGKLAEINRLRSLTGEGRPGSISSWARYDHLKRDVKSLEIRSIRTMAETIELIAEGQKLESLAVLLPGSDGGDMWDVRNDWIYFAEETFSEDTVNGRGEIVDACLAEAVARSMGAKEVVVRADEWLGFMENGRDEWAAWGWRVGRIEAWKKLLPGPDRISTPRLLA